MMQQQVCAVQCVKPLVYIRPMAKTWPARVRGKWDIAGSLVNADSRLGGQFLKVLPSQKPDLALAISKLLLDGCFP